MFRWLRRLDDIDVFFAFLVLVFVVSASASGIENLIDRSARRACREHGGRVVTSLDADDWYCGKVPGP